MESDAEYIGLVRYHAQKAHVKCPRSVELGDLVAYGMIGLAEARLRYRPEKGAFATFASWRIRGAILDGLRAIGESRAGSNIIGSLTDIDATAIDSLQADCACPLDEIERSEVRARVRAVLASMPQDQAARLVACEVHERSCADYGRQVGESRSWAHRKLGEARKVFAAAMEDQE